MLRLIGRILLIPIGAMLAVIASAAVFFLLGYEYVAEATAISTDDAETMIDGWINFASDASNLLGYLSLATVLPGLILIIVGEAASIRSSIYYVVGAGLALAAMPVLYDLSSSNEISQTARDVLPMFATAGFAGGFVYWLIAGRTA
jgi:hypothetical protein